MLMYSVPPDYNHGVNYTVFKCKYGDGFYDYRVFSIVGMGFAGWRISTPIKLETLTKHPGEDLFSFKTRSGSSYFVADYEERTDDSFGSSFKQSIMDRYSIVEMTALSKSEWVTLADSLIAARILTQQTNYNLEA